MRIGFGSSPLRRESMKALHNGGIGGPQRRLQWEARLLPVAINAHHQWGTRLPGRGLVAQRRRVLSTHVRASSESGPNEESKSQTSKSRGSSSGRPSAEPAPASQDNHTVDMRLAVLTMPLLYAAMYAKSDSHWLAQRHRNRWWKRGDTSTLKIPKDRLENVALPPDESPTELWMKVIPLGLVFFCASFNLTILQNLKDAIMVTTAGVETLPFLAAFCVLPAMLGFFMYYNHLVSQVRPKQVFYWAIAPLIAFYMLFATVLYPASAALHPHALMAQVAGWLPSGLGGLVKVAEHWTFSLFFCAAEMWGAVVIALLFWSLANEVCTVAEAKTVYPMMGISANIALVVAGSYVKYVNRSLFPGAAQASLQLLVATICATTALMMGIKYFIDAKIVKDAEEGREPKAAAKTKKKKSGSKGTFGESISVLRSSPKIMNLAVLVVSYALSHRLFEFAWKGALRILHPTATAYQAALADVSIATGYTTIALMLTGKFVFEYLGWGFAAAATPIVMLVAGGVFFGLSVASQTMPTQAGFLAGAGATMGGVTQVFARSAKFSLFDPAKEMVYIEMDKEEKSRGKAAVDLVGSQIGKSGAAWACQALLLAFGSASTSLPFISVIFVGVIFMWVRSVYQLRSQMQEVERKRKEERDASRTGAQATASSSAPAESAAIANGSGAAVLVGAVAEGLAMETPIAAASASGNGVTNGHGAAPSNGNGKSEWTAGGGSIPKLEGHARMRFASDDTAAVARGPTEPTS